MSFTDVTDKWTGREDSEEVTECRGRGPIVVGPL